MLVWSGHKTKVRSLAFSPDGTRLVSSAERVVGVKLWDPATGTAAGTLKGGGGHTAGVAFSPDGALIATMNSFLMIWDAVTLRPTSVAYGSRVYHGPAFAPDGASVAATGWDRVSVWNAPGHLRPDTLQVVRADWLPDTVLLSTVTDNRFSSVVFDPAGAWVAANGTTCATVWDRATGAVRCELRHRATDALSVIAFSPDGGRIAFSHSKVVEIHALDGEAEPVVLVGHTLFVRAIGFTPDGATVMTAASDGTVRFWDAHTGTPGRVFDWGIGRVYSAAFSPGALTCAAGGEKGQLVVWDVDL